MAGDLEMEQRQANRGIGGELVRVVQRVSEPAAFFLAVVNGGVNARQMAAEAGELQAGAIEHRG